MALDVDALQQELQQIQQEREVVNERLRAFGPAFRGRGGRGGRGGFPGRGGLVPPLAGRLDYGAPGLGPRDFRGPEGPGPSRDGPSRGFRDGPEQPYRDSMRPPFRDLPGRDARPEPLGHRRSSSMHDDIPPASQGAPQESAGAKRKLASAVVVKDEPDAQDGEVAAKRPRQLAVTEDPSEKKKNRRMFGFLQGHLGKSREESSQFKQSEVAQKRREAVQQADARKREEAAKAREAAKQEMIARRQAEIDKKRDLAAQVDIKKLEIMVAQRIRHHVKLAQFLRTKAGPPLLWLPKSRLDATDKLLEQQQTILQLWQEQELASLEQERQRILGRLQQTQPPALKSVVAVPKENGAEAMEEGEGADEGEESGDNQEEQREAGAAGDPTSNGAASANEAAPPAAKHTEDHTDRYQPAGSPEPTEEPQQLPVQSEAMDEDIDNPYED
ncbi:hypothetical protein WJX74_004615 [Apatococcus lobatus]|uniref:Pinin/SDK/MemA protein domain-containing protein n=1 Tax=Apatococcus lobatus TaxID=904363 RepID=A0AAW1RH35_9CHLO